MSYAPGSQQAQHYHPGAPHPQQQQQPPPPVDERYAYTSSAAPVIPAGATDSAGYAPNLAGAYAADIAPYAHQQQHHHQQQQAPMHSLSSHQQHQQLPARPPPLVVPQPYYDGAYNGQHQPPGVDMRNNYPVGHHPPHSAPPLQAVHPSQQGHYSIQGSNPGTFQAQNLPPGLPHPDAAGQYHNQAPSHYAPPPPQLQQPQGQFSQPLAQPYQQQPPQQYAYSSVSASATETYAHGQPQYQQQQQPPPPMVHAHTTGPYGSHPPHHHPVHASGHIPHNAEVYHQHAPQPEQQYYAPPPPQSHQQQPQQQQPHHHQQQQYQHPPPSHQQQQQVHQPVALAQPAFSQSPQPPTSTGGAYAYSQPETGYYRQEPVQTVPSPLYQSPYQQQQQLQQQQRQQQVQQQQQQAYQQQANNSAYSGSAYSLPPPTTQPLVHYSPPNVAQAVPQLGDMQPPASRYRAQVPPAEPHAQHPLDAQQHMPPPSSHNQHQHRNHSHQHNPHHDHIHGQGHGHGHGQGHGHDLGPQQAHHPMPPPSQQRQHQQHPPPPHQSPSPQAQQMVGPQRLNSHRASVGHNDPARIPGARPVMATRQDARLSYAEHNTQYIAGHPPISSVLTAEPIVAQVAPLSSAGLQRKHTIDPRNSYGGSPQVGDGGSVGSAQGRRREASDYHDQQRESSGYPLPMGATQHSNNVSALVNSMGALSVASGQQYGASPPQQQQQQFNQSSALTASAMSVPNSQHLHSSQATLQGYPVNGSASTLLGSGAFAGTDLNKSSTPTLVQSSANIGYPLWHNIDANSFHAYRHHINVQKSNLSGSKYALVIGINYYGVEYSQTSNINSAHTMKTLLMSKYGYLEKNVTLLSDDLKDQRFHPTHQLITKHIGRMMSNVRPNDSVFFYFCGFGRLPSQVLERRSEVLSGIRRLRSDYILPADFEQYGAIDATYLHNHLVHKLPPSARLTALFNCIVNETGMGVPYKYTTNGMAVLTNAIAGSNLFEAGAKMTQQNLTGSFGDLSQRFETSLMQQQKQQCAQHQPLATDGLADEEVSRLKQSSGDIIVFGWDRDYANPKHKKYLAQTPSNHLGSYWAAAMESALRNKSKATFGDILHYLQGSTKELVMMPFVATGRKISMDEEFVI
ncbi:Ca(2+)-dependent cysteine protease [Coemansia pectinata]|uniref:Ca(2+)-dependent cysteine protease n=1 Tax=Coemansia pectinata TaxID=1052879 RepID=A0A9W8LD32_9FUNG|nr:Ca(2+)-dependent cysteine protease [Coemansia pectinata]